MTLKDATLLAIIGLFVQILISLAYLLRIEFYEGLNIIGIICNMAPLPFFILLYQKQKNGN